MFNTIKPVAALPPVRNSSADRFWKAMEEHNCLRRVFLTLCVCFWGLLGGLLCLLVCKLLTVSPQWDWLLCAAGYPALLLGLWGGVIALYRRTDPKP